MLLYHLPLHGRLLWFTGEVSEYVIETELIHLDLDIEMEVERKAVGAKDSARALPKEQVLV
jgi:hypothetical protein